MATTITPTIPLVGAFGNSGSTPALNLAPIVPQTPTAGAPNPAGLASAMTTASTTPAVPAIAPNLSTSLSAALASLSKSLQSYVTPPIPATTPAAMSLPYTQPANAGSTVPLASGSGSTGSGTGGGLAPAGMMYNGQGQLVPISSGPANVGTNSGATVNPATGSVVKSAPASGVTGSGTTGVTGSTGTTAGTTAATGTTPPVPSTGSTPSTTTPPPVPATVASAEAAVQADEATLGGIQSSYYGGVNDENGQPSDLAFKTGEEGELLTQAQQAEAGPLAKLQADQTVLGTAQQQNTPITIAPGSTAITPANPNTPLGTGGADSSQAASDLATNAPFDPSSALDQYVQQYMQTGQIPSNAQAQAWTSLINQRADQISMQQKKVPFNPQSAAATYASLGSTLTVTQNTQSATSTALNTFGSNANSLLTTIAANGLNPSQVPMVNSALQALGSLGLDTSDPNTAADVATFTNSMNTLQAEYSKLLAGTGSPTEGGASRATEALPGNLSVAGLQEVVNRIITEGNARMTSLNATISSLNQQMNPYDFSGTGSTTTLGTSGTGSSSGTPMFGNFNG